MKQEHSKSAKLHVWQNINGDTISFYRAALNAGRSSEEKAVSPSVCLWNVHCDKDLSTFLYHTKDHLV